MANSARLYANLFDRESEKYEEATCSSLQYRFILRTGNQVNIRALKTPLLFVKALFPLLVDFGRLSRKLGPGVHEWF